MYKIVIADDEAIECRSLEERIQEGMECCAVIASVYNGMELIKVVEEKNPDIVIVDLNMPGLTGLDAIEILRKKKKRLKIIINTAYSDFEYIKKAMKYQVVDYVLKPAKSEELYAALRNICAQLDEEQKVSERNSLFEKMEVQIAEITKSHFMESLLLGEMDKESFEILHKDKALQDTASVMFFSKSFERIDVKMNKRMMQQLVELLEKRLSSVGLFMWKWYQDGIYCLSVPHNFTDEFQNCFMQNVRETVKEVERLWKTSLIIGVSEWKEIPEELVQAPKECQAALQGRAKAGIYSFSRKTKLGVSIAAPVFSRIMRSYSEQGVECAIRMLKQNLAEEENKEVFFPAFKIGAILCLIRILFQENKKGGRWVGHSVMRWEEWMMAENYQELAENMEKLKIFQEEKSFVEVNAYVLSALDYMEKQYASDLSLDDVAEYVGITPFYMSRLFRKDAGANFIEILTDMRMGKALELLCEDDCSIKEVCERTGYISLSYFYKVFKKYFGITAGDILVSLAQIP